MAYSRTSHQVEELDALIIGAGFSGVYQLKKLRDEGYKVKLVECGSSYGGIWYWNRYPGARVDSQVPHYQFSDPELWKNWNWKQRFPDHCELRAYFEYLADKWHLQRDTYFDTFIQSAFWDESQCSWIIQAADGRLFRSQFFLPNTGITSKRFFPEWKGIGSFKGTILHSSYWPHEGLDLAGKRVAVVGTGSTGVQLSHALSSSVSELVVFQRTPAMTIPMKQVEYTGREGNVSGPRGGDFFKSIKSLFWGLDFDFISRKTLDDDAVERRKNFESLWEKGDFAFWLGCYSDMLFNEAANAEAYNFWREKTLPRIHDSRMKELLAPEIQRYPFGSKRVALENGYYEIFNQPNVHLVDVNQTPVVEATDNGLNTADGKAWKFDVIILATGFDAVTGGLTNIDIRGIEGQSLKEKWQREKGPRTYLGISVAGFPNMFFSYGPQAPSAFCNGPTCAEFQGDWIVDAMKYVRTSRLAGIVADEESERGWCKETDDVANASLLTKGNSWYMGDNIPGKPRASLMYLGGVPTYRKRLGDCVAADYRGFERLHRGSAKPIAMSTALRKSLVYLASTFAVMVAAWEVRANFVHLF